MIATNLLVFQEALRLVGPIKLIDYGEEVTADKLWEKAQFYSQERFFPGSKQKREFLKDLAKGLLMKMGDAGLFQKLKLLNLAVKMANEKQIMIYSNEGGFQKFLETVGWGGEVRQRNCPAWLVNCVADSLMVVEANLGVNKSNCCVERKARLEMKKNENGWDHKLTLIYENHSGDSAWGGKYKAWVRLIIPSSASCPCLRSKLHSVRHNLRAIFLLAVLVIPTASLNPTFNQNRLTFFQILTRRFRLSSKYHNIMKIRLFLFVSLLIFPNTVGGNRETANLNSAW